MTQLTVSDKARFDLTVVVLALLTMFGPLSIDMYLPAFGDIAASYSTESNRVELSLTSFFLGLFIGQLLYGTASDKWGRKPPLYFGLVIYIVSSLACAYAPNLESLIVLRFFQAIGSCAGLVIARAMVRDLYTPQASAQVFSFLILVMGIAPILAPLAGAYVTKAFGWQAIFVIVAALAVACMAIVHVRLPETRSFNGAVRMRRSLPIYWDVLKDRGFLRYSLAGGIAQSGLFAYITGSPLVFIDHFGLDPTHYSWLFGLNAIGIIGMAQFNAWLLRRRDARKILNKSLPVLALISLLTIVFASLNANFWLVLMIVFAYVSTLGMVFPNAMAGALAEQQERAGSASAVTGSLQFLIAGIISAVVNVVGHITPLGMLYVIGACGLTATLLYRVLRTPS
ncbi:multidrug effflux MFS transporter [Pseudidiomarina terrestris]|uniref:Bcr/CflA family efflux transporter n=1 Tax=Pseudidiomarina terrestris TaxID=2820060 RepID=A0AAW7QVL9_9GAMM|nr:MULTISPECIES: multidrug effflux MFS transporter [unclassified Pseudidiomarina]MDN7123943.1 multidrug effflux MFS transporter [Pseudidiomarina sp. 1APP75-32.1]MDN7127697.1 multidrug effflux MFS transporter [Pseudidiomarina sp. 1APR75-33.1]MDN7130443.1 multidrug effflux MFS transporter [Pseudidiomarina sp. 1APR75-15]MDN7136366.1 multidrug effflux MFS transporter [Pseudidiomarina sp. 1ASP75-5]MDN7138717.1 multidrug effflux MFS transporter [Pseudidiomarina sp. 1ASP75-14]